MSLAIESGATNTVAVYLPNGNNNEMKRFHFGGANFKLMKESQLESFLNDIRNTTNKFTIQRLAIGMPGIIHDRDRKVLHKVASMVWPKLTNIWVGDDLEVSLACIDKKYKIKCIVISGTGSCCYGDNGEKSLKIGGYGHILGDAGSGYAIAHMALRKSLKDFEYNHLTENDVHDDKSVLLNLILKYLNMSSLYELVGWSLCASKAEIADLAQLVIRQWTLGNDIAKDIVNIAIEDLVSDTLCLIKKLKDGKDINGSEIQIGLTGSLMTKNEKFSYEIAKRLKSSANVIILKDTVMGALKMIASDYVPQNDIFENGIDYNNMSNEELATMVLPISTSLPVTEQRNPRSMNLDTMTIAEGIELMISEESSIHKEIIKHKSSIETMVKRISNAFRTGGRLFYVGAGTSGRLGVLDASECVPTFKSPPHWVQGIIAGGDKALKSSIEGAEDSVIDGIKAIEMLNVNDNDIVIGIAACGRTPYVWGSLYGAKIRKAFTCFINMNDQLKYRLTPDVVISVNVGPEVLTGSTRLKSGSATKCILNMLTTLSMVQYGKCLENLMVDLSPANSKLRDRALRITLLIVNNDNQYIDSDSAQMVLMNNNYDIRNTVKELREMIAEENKN